MPTPDIDPTAVIVNFHASLTILLVSLWLSGCQPAVYLMPTPVVLYSDEIKAFEDKQADIDSNIVSIFYATNRLPIGIKSDRHYTTTLTDSLRLGQTGIRIGKKSKPWDILKTFSTTEIRDKPLKLFLEQSTEKGKLETTQDANFALEDSKEFIAAINRALQENASKDITVYVHGATASFYTAVAQAAQIRHFTGYNHIVLAFSWATAENFLFYGTDINNAKQAAPLLAEFLQFLAQNTDVEKINILSYSAGGLIASSALSLLGKRQSELTAQTPKQNLKLGEAYFAAPDVDLQTYVEQLPDYLILINNVTIAMNPDDFVLNLASFHQGTSRAGRPDARALNKQQIQWLDTASTKGNLNVIRILPEILSDYDSGAHDFWFSHPWVSTDVLIQMLFHAAPAQRGLKAKYTENFKWWYFPQQYPDHIVKILKGLGDRAEKPN